MMRSYRSLIVAGVAAMTAGCLSGEPTPEFMPPLPYDIDAPVSPQQLDSMPPTFDQLKHELARTQPEVQDIQLQVLLGNESTNCPIEGEQYAASADNPDDIMYCYSRKKVIVSQAALNSLTYVSTSHAVDERFVRDLSLAHELGHAWQQAAGEDVENLPYLLIKRLELQADCIGGAAIAIVSPEARQAASAIYDAFGYALGFHGSSEERLAQFDRGFDGGITAC